MNESLQREIEFDPTLLDLGADVVLFDLGCGEGDLSLALAPHVRKVVAIELDALATAKLREEATRRGITNIEIVNDDIGAAPNASLGKADVLIVREVLEHVADLESILDVISGLAAPGTRCLLTFPTANTEAILQRISPTFMDSCGHVRVVDPDHVEAFLANKGFQLIRREKRNAYWFFYWLINGVLGALPDGRGQLRQPSIPTAIMSRAMAVARRLVDGSFVERHWGETVNQLCGKSHYLYFKVTDRR